jgi:hypothetical protein
MRQGRVWALVLVVALLGAAYAQVSSGQRQLQAQRAEQFHNDVIAYAAFHSDMSELGAAQIASEADVDNALELVARHNSEALVRGWMLYNADVAAQSPAFVAGVREQVRRTGGAPLRTIAAQRSFARRLAGSDEAIRLVLNAAAADSARVATIAERFRRQAEMIEQEPWAASDATGQIERLERLRTLSLPGGFSPSVSIALAARLAPAPLSIPLGADNFGGSRFWDAVSGAPFMLSATSPPAMALREDERRSETVDAILSLAALRVLGANRADIVELYVRDPRSIGCMELARLQFHQCVSASRFVYENAHCLARHGLRDTAMCIGALGIPVRPDATLMAQAPASAASAAPPAQPSRTTPAPQSNPPIAPRVTFPPRATTPAPPAQALQTAPAPQADIARRAATPAPPVVRQQAANPQAQPGAARAPTAPATPTAQPAFAASLSSLGPGELFARADELDEQGARGEARIVRRTLIARFPDSPLALVAAQQLAASNAPSEANR